MESTRASSQPRFEIAKGHSHQVRFQALQPKLRINQPGDKYEQEADRVAEQVMRMPEPTVQRKCSCGGGGCPKCQGKHSDGEHELLQMKHVGASSLGPDEAPPIVHEVLREPGQPIDVAVREDMQGRFGHDLSHIRIHADPRANGSASAIAANAYTVGPHIVFAPGQYSPGSDQGKALLAHELAHTFQQGSHSHVRRQPAPVVPDELQTCAIMDTMTDAELQNRFDWIGDVLGQFTTSTAQTDMLFEEQERIGVELSRRRALAAGRTFSEDAITRTRTYFQRNAKAKPQDSCIVALNNAAKLLYDDPKMKTTPHSIEKTMELFEAASRSGQANELWFLDSRGRRNTGSQRPGALQNSVWDALIALAAGDAGWSVFTMSVMDGNHSVTLTLDNTNPSSPRVYWSDQWSTKGGWKSYDRSTLDQEVLHLVQSWWDGQEAGREFTTVVRLWRLKDSPSP